MAIRKKADRTQTQSSVKQGKQIQDTKTKTSVTAIRKQSAVKTETSVNDHSGQAWERGEAIIHKKQE